MFNSKLFLTNNQNSITFIENFINNRKQKSSSNNNLFIINNFVDFVNNFIISINDFNIFNEKLFANVENIRFRYKNDLLFYVNELDDEKKTVYI